MPHEILVVEDDLGNQRLLCEVLECGGHRCTVVDSAEAAFAELERAQPALILLDINLPGMSGVDAARELKRRPGTRAIKLIGLSAHALISERALIETGDFDAFLTKPFSYKALLELIQTLLSSGAPAAG